MAALSVKQFEALKAANPKFAAKAEEALAKTFKNTDEVAKESGVIGKTIKGAGLMAAGGGLLGLGAAAGRAGAGASPKSSVVAPVNAGGGTLSSAARTGISGGGSLPALKTASTPSVSETMTTNKILIQACKYLASIDASLKNQVAFQRFDYTQSQNAQREISAESGSNVGSSLMSSTGNVIEGALKGIASTLLNVLGIFALLGVKPLIEKIKEKIKDPEFISGAISNVATAGNVIGMGLTAAKLYKGVKTAQSVGKAISGIGGMVKPVESITTAVTKSATKTARVWEEVSTGLGKTSGKFVTKEVAETAEKVVGKGVAKTLTKGAEKGVLKALTKTAIFSAVKKIPGIGLLLGLGLGAMRISSGDYVGGAMEIVSGVLSSFPGAGTMLSLGVDAALVAKDLGVFGGNKSGAFGGGPNGSGATTTATSGSTRKARGAKNYVPPKNVYDYMRSKGLSDAHAKGMMANIQAESSFDSAVVNPNDRGAPAGGLFQHRADRFTSMKAYANDPNDSTGESWKKNWKKQIDFALTEAAGKRYAATKFSSAAEATDSFTRKFEIPRDVDVQSKKRINNLAGIEEAIKAPAATITNAAVANTPRKSDTAGAGKSQSAPVIVNNVQSQQAQQSSGGKVPNPSKPNNSSHDKMAYFSANARA